MKRIRVMLVDDHTVVRAGMRMLINNQPDMEVVAEADNSQDALKCCLSSEPDVLVLDLSLPGGASLPVIEQLQSRAVHSHVLVLTMHDDPAYVRAALAAGATGYVVKKIREHDLLEAIRATARGRTVIDLDDEVKTADVFQSLRSSRTGELTVKLSEREIEVLRLLSRGLTNRAAAEQLDISPKTVATYRARIAEKLGIKTTAEFVKYAVDMGLISPSE
jgi:DNA-binding NarL/FixJ family response regulator